MATFKVFVPVQGEVIYRIEANNATDAENIVSTMDWSDGELNVEQDYTYNAGTHVELIAGVEGDLDDDAEALALTVNLETFHPYVMRHFQP